MRLRPDRAASLRSRLNTQPIILRFFNGPITRSPNSFMNLSLSAMSIALPKLARHPNRLPFRGVLTVLDVPSDRAPAGARGHRVLLTRAAAEAALPSLLGMALDYTPALDGHDARRKVGIITSADIAARAITCSRDGARPVSA